MESILIRGREFPIITSPWRSPGEKKGKQSVAFNLLWIKCQARVSPISRVGGDTGMCGNWVKTVTEFIPSAWECPACKGIIRLDDQDQIHSADSLIELMAEKPNHPAIETILPFVIKSEPQLVDEEPLIERDVAVYFYSHDALSKFGRPELNACISEWNEGWRLMTPPRMDRSVQDFYDGTLGKSGRDIGSEFSSIFIDEVEKTFLGETNSHVIEMPGIEDSNSADTTSDALRAWVNLAEVAYANGDYQHAIKTAQKAIEVDPGFANAWRVLGASHGELGNNQQAAETMHKYVRLAPEDAFGWKLLGIYCGRTGNYQRAIEATRKSLELDSSDAMAWYTLGWDYGALDNYEQAVEAMQKCLELDPNMAAAWHNLGTFFGRMGNYQRATEATRKSLELDSSDAEAWSSLGLWYIQIDNVQLAIDAYSEVLALSSDPDLTKDAQDALVYLRRV